MDRYWRSLGKFINDFTTMEAFVADLLSAEAGISDEMGRALFSGTRIDTLIGFIRKCYIVKNATPAPYLDRALKQAKALNTARNTVAHRIVWEIEDEEDQLLASNRLRSMAKKDSDVLVIPEMLDDMAHDARIIVAMLAVAESEARDPGSSGDLPQEFEDAQTPWRYKDLQRNRSP